MKKRIPLFALIMLLIVLVSCGKSNEIDVTEKYEKYDPLISAIEAGNEEEAIKIVHELIPKSESEDNQLSEVAAEYVGTWVSDIDSDCKFKLDNDYAAYIGDKQFTWEVRANDYGPYAIRITVDDGAGMYEFSIGDDKSVLSLSAQTVNMPEYLSDDGLKGSFTKVD